MKIGYARVSTKEQNLDRQIDALQQAGCEKIFSEQISGAKKERPELNMLLSQIRDGDQLVIDKLSRLGRSLKDLIQIVSDLEDRGVTFISLKDAIDTSSASGRVRPTLDAEVKIPSLNVHLVHSLRCSSFSLTSLLLLQSLSEI